ncbi:transcription elongation factor A protein 2 isoform X2 [Elephas maximus indicus]|uniref:transcription elongation factor A protein 2 isoform X2 n=1 Tax=Elephas maximus indicus TaxID=99487 RepID=UPI0021171AD4|nr:transcription elongation factor A protein 2 isoform X2 [Elephas maximus indicus]
MGKEEEIARIARRLDKMVTKKSVEGAMDLLRELKAMPVTLHLLQSTRIGMSVNALRKQSSDEEVIALAKSLIKSWKKLLDASDAKAGERRSTSLASLPSKDTSEGKAHSRKRPELPRTPSTPRMTTFPPVPITCDAVRNKCREMLAAALQTDREFPPATPRSAQSLILALALDTSSKGSVKDSPAPSPAQCCPLGAGGVFGTQWCVPSCCPGVLGGWRASGRGWSGLPLADDHVAIGADCEHLSAQIEECIFRDVGSTDVKYKNRVRSRISNLKDAKNPGLRRSVLCGTIAPQRIAEMTSEEMASDELKEIRKAMTREAIREHQMARASGTHTDLFTCGRCKRKSCTYTQVQTRSSDEPMTTFVVCNECGNRWKFC